MQTYANLGENSGVAAYECGPDSIAVQFHDGHVYVYDYGSCGSMNCEEMKRLAAQGVGLNSFIMRNVRFGYSSHT